MPESFARGRTADVYDDGPGRVLRRYRDGRDASGEVAVMRAVAAAGYPIPAVFEAEGPDIVMERVTGPTLAGYLARRPWKLRWGAAVLTDLIDRLASVPCIPGLAEPFGPGEVLLHLDLHPMNVLLGASGPMVIDWPLAAWGPTGLERAQTWLLIESSDVPTPAVIRRPARLAQQALARTILGSDERSRSWIHTVAVHRLTDPNVTPVEATRLRAIRDRHAS